MQQEKVYISMYPFFDNIHQKMEFSLFLFGIIFQKQQKEHLKTSVFVLSNQKSFSFHRNNLKICWKKNFLRRGKRITVFQRHLNFYSDKNNASKDDLKSFGVRKDHFQVKECILIENISLFFLFYFINLCT